jgi:hypothetical protein
MAAFAIGAVGALLTVFVPGMLTRELRVFVVLLFFGAPIAVLYVLGAAFNLNTNRLSRRNGWAALAGIGTVTAWLCYDWSRSLGEWD